MKKIMTVMLFASAVAGASAQGVGAGIKMQNLDTSVKAGDDFYKYACGGWEKKLSDLYKMAMDMKRRNKDGVAPVMPIIRKLEDAKTKEELFGVQKELLTYGSQQFFSFGFAADEKNSTQNILNISQGGITLGQKEYYLDDDEATRNIREAYKKHVVKMFQLFGFSKKEAQKKMENLLKVETALAQVSKSRTELRDVEANYNKMTLSDFTAKYPNMRLLDQATAMGVKAAYIQEMVVGQPSFMEGADKVVGALTPDEYRDYMEWGEITGAASCLSDKLVAENFDFFGKTMRGRKEMHPLWKRATAQVEGAMGEALGKMYVERYFPASSKERMERLVRNLQLALAERILAQTWMETDTKLAALAKLSTFYVKIGYPDKWKDYSTLNIDPSKSYYENMLECSRFSVAKNIEEKAGKPVDNQEWFMTPQTVNAYYNPTTNEICFPAGILQYPFFDPTADDAFNYGAIGVVIGHEMTHGFDDQGRHYDKAGNMVDWWTEGDGKGFEERTGKYADFFSAIKVLPDLNANGKLTLGENLADHGGLQVAWYAYKNATRNNPLPVINGLTADQRFFLAYAGVWAANITEKEIRSRTKSDPHSLGRWRVNGALPHIDMWYEAFGVSEGDKMFIPKSNRLDLW